MRRVIRFTALAALSFTIIAGTKAITSKLALVKNGTESNVQFKHAGMTCWLLPGELMQCPLAEDPINLLTRNFAINVPQKESMGLPVFNVSQHAFSIENTRSPVGIVILNNDLEVSIVNGDIAEQSHMDLLQFSHHSTHSAIGGLQSVPAA